MKHAYTLFLCCVLLLGVVILGSYQIWRGIGCILIVGSVLLGFVSYTCHPIQKEGCLLDEADWVVGTIKEVATYDFATYLILDEIKIPQKGKVRTLQSNLSVQASSSSAYTVGMRLKVQGKVQVISPQMNPSDFDRPLYMLGKKVNRELRATEVEVIGERFRPFYKLREKLGQRIEQVFQGKDKGLVATLLLGERRDMDTDVLKVYQQMGIAHVLAISGLHMGVFFALFWWVLGKCRWTYGYRLMGCIGGIWGYACLVGLPVSVVRACLILTLRYGGRMLWQEEDDWISLAVAALCILLLNPYQLFQVGFQLSFIAFLSVMVVSRMMRTLKENNELATKGQWLRQFIISTLLLNAGIAPVVAWHFYEVPFLSGLLSALLIPFFTCLIPGLLVVLALSYIALPVAQGLGSIICLLLEWVSACGAVGVQLPFATWLVGRPSGLAILLWYMLLFCVMGYGLWRHHRKYYVAMGILILLGSGIGSIFEDKALEIMHLYVGQGDAAVIQVPSGEVILIDGGPEGKEKVIINYLRYKGIKGIDYAVVSHAHEDHVGGVIGCIESGLPVKNVLMPKMPVDDVWEARLRETCRAYEVPYITIQKADQLVLGAVTIEILYPHATTVSHDLNDLSAVCLITYGGYSQLFTGDLTTVGETFIQELPRDITVLKVGHHGSKYSTSNNFLDLITPKYGMISCGIGNFYGHPSDDVLERLLLKDVKPLRTDQGGATKFLTNGRSLSIVSHIQEDP